MTLTRVEKYLRLGGMLPLYISESSLDRLLKILIFISLYILLNKSGTLLLLKKKKGLQR